MVMLRTSNPLSTDQNFEATNQILKIVI